MSRHPLHPALVHFPIACWSLAVLADFASLWLGEQSWRWSGGLLTVGCLTAIVAMTAGLIELAHVPEGVALRDTHWHMAIMLVASTLFTLRLVLRLDNLTSLPPNHTSLLIDAVGFIMMAIGGWVGGRLVYHHGIGRN